MKKIMYYKKEIKGMWGDFMPVSDFKCPKCGEWHRDVYDVYTHPCIEDEDYMFVAYDDTSDKEVKPEITIYCEEESLDELFNTEVR